MKLSDTTHQGIAMVCMAVAMMFGYDLYLHRGTAPAKDELESSVKILIVMLSAGGALWMLVAKHHHELHRDRKKNEFEKERDDERCRQEQARDNRLNELANRAAELKAEIDRRAQYDSIQANEAEENRKDRRARLRTLSRCLNDTTRSFKTLTASPAQSDGQLVASLQSALLERFKLQESRDAVQETQELEERLIPGIGAYTTLLVNIIIDVRRPESGNSVGTSPDQYRALLKSYHEKLVSLHDLIAKGLSDHFKADLQPPVHIPPIKGGAGSSTENCQ